jgi:serine protease
MRHFNPGCGKTRLYFKEPCMKSFSSLRLGVMAVALMLAIPAVRAADTQSTSSSRFSLVTQANESYDSFIITYRDGTAEHSNSLALLQNVKAAVSRVGLDRVTVSSTGTQMAPLSVSYQRKLGMGADLVKTSRKLSQAEANQLIQQLAVDPAVAYVQPNYRLHMVRDIAAPVALNAMRKAQVDSSTSQTTTSDDPLYSTHQWDYWDATGGANINTAWELADGTGVTVAVIDTGITQHPDLDTSLADEGYDFISDPYLSGRDTEGRVPGGWDTGDWTNTAPWNDPVNGCVDPGSSGQPSSWHGTHVSGTVAELTNNSAGLAGTAYNAKVLPIRVLGHCGGDVADIADAITWASGGDVPNMPSNTHVAQVINMSLGGFGVCSASDAMGASISQAIRRGTTVVVAAGNDADDSANYSPASCPGVITVASNGAAGKRAFYSNYGSKITLSAPGGSLCPDDSAPSANGLCSDGSDYRENLKGWVFSALNDGETTPGQPNYAGYIGTSQAAPHVAGAVALMLSATQAAGLPQPTSDKIKDILVKSARSFPVADDGRSGAGILDAHAAVKMAVNSDDNGGGTIARLLTKGVLVPGQNAIVNGTLYAIDVPAGATTLNLRTLGGAGDVALYVKAGSAPAADGSNADFTSTKRGTSQAVVIQKPQAARYYLRVAPQPGSSFTNISVLADYNP